MSNEPTPKTGDLFTRDYMTFHRVNHLNDLRNLPSDPLGSPKTPETVLHIIAGGNWRKAVRSYCSVPGNESVQVWDVNTSVPMLVSVTE